MTSRKESKNVKQSTHPTSPSQQAYLESIRALKSPRTFSAGPTAEPVWPTSQIPLPLSFVQHPIHVQADQNVHPVSTTIVNGQALGDSSGQGHVSLSSMLETLFAAEPYAMTFTFGHDVNVVHADQLAQWHVKQGSLWMMYLHLQPFDTVEQSVMEDIEFRLFRSLSRGLQVEFYKNGDLARSSIHFYLYTGFPRCLVTSGTMLDQEASQLKYAIEQFFQDYVEGTRLGDACLPVVHLTKVTSTCF